MNHKQQAFVNAYLETWNASEAARRAGYNGKSNVVGAQLLANVSIAAEIKRRVAELAMSADEVLVRLGEQARGSMEDFLEFEEVVYDPPRLDDAGHELKRAFVCTGINLGKAKARGKLHLLKSVQKGKQGLKIELYDAQAALALLGKAHGLFVERTEHTGRGGGPIEHRAQVVIVIPDNGRDGDQAAAGTADGVPG